MKILVVWTPDGDVYYSDDNWDGACRKAVSIVMRDDTLKKYDVTDREIVKPYLSDRSLYDLYEALLKIGAMKEVETQK